MTNDEHDDATPSLSSSEMLDSLEEQLIALYQEKQEGLASLAAMQETIDNLEAQIVELYREKKANLHKDETISNLEAQLVSLYEERDALAYAA